MEKTNTPSVGDAVRTNFKLLVLAIQCDLINLPATKRRVRIMEILSKIEKLTDELDKELEQ